MTFTRFYSAQSVQPGQQEYWNLARFCVNGYMREVHMRDKCTQTNVQLVIFAGPVCDE